MENKKKWYQKTGGIIFWLIVFFPVGLYLMWKHANWHKTAKWVVTAVYALLFLNGMVSSSSSDVSKQNAAPQSAQQSAQPSPTPKPTGKPAEKTLFTGADGILNYNEDIANCEGTVVVGATKDDWIDW
jgi:hypothetical protein